MKKILLISFLFLLLSFNQVQAAGLVPCGGYEFDQDDNLITSPLAEPVPSGWAKISDTEMAKLEPVCTFCHFFVMINNIIKFVMFTLVPVVAVLMLIVGGVMFFFAGAKPDILIRARGVITSTFIGLLIIFCAWVIVNTVLTKIGIIEAPSLLQWHQINCSIQ